LDSTNLSELKRGNFDTPTAFTSEVKSSRRVEFLGEVVCIDNIEYDDVKLSMNGILLSAIESLEKTSRSVTNCVSYLQNIRKRSKAVLGARGDRPADGIDESGLIGQPILTHKQLSSNLINYILPNFSKEYNMIDNTAPSAAAVEFLSHWIINRCNDLGEIIIIQGGDRVTHSKDVGDSWVLLDLDLLSCNILGGIVEKHYSDRGFHLLTEEDLRECFSADPNLVSLERNSFDMLTNLLCYISACIPITLSGWDREEGICDESLDLPCDSSNEKEKQGLLRYHHSRRQRLFFPMIQGAHRISDDIIPVEFNNTDPLCHIIVREYRLTYTDVDMFPPGYFEELFVKIVKLEQPDLVDLRAFEDALLIQRDTESGLTVQIIIELDALQFSVRVSTATSPAPLQDSSMLVENSRYALTLLDSIRTIINQVGTPHLTEYCCQLSA
jgi:hypothetical protein